MPSDYVVRPADAASWPEIERLFGERGACAGCWCMYWRRSHAEYEAGKGEGNRRELKALVTTDRRPGVLAYDGERPIGWCSVAPRDCLPRLERSRILKPVDETPVWSIICFFVDRAYRHQGLQERLLEGAAELARARGASVLEAYPVEPKKPEMPAVFAWTGFASVFETAGFEEVARRSSHRPIMRLRLLGPADADG